MTHKRKYKFALNNELELDLSLNAISLDQLKDECKKFIDHFKTSGTTYTDFVFESINYQTFLTQLYSLIASDPIIKPFIRGLRIFPGMDNSDNIILLYVLEYLKDSGKTDDGTSTGNEVYNIRPDSNNVSVYYMYDGANFVSAPESYAVNYQKNILIKHTDDTGESYKNYIDNVDIKAILFPFQEIFAMYEDNTPPNGTLIENDTIHFCSVANKNDSGQYVHTIVISPINPTASGPFLPPTFTAKAANLANMCPPNCDTLKIAINKTTNVGVIQPKLRK